ncbi:hypothetical protein AABB24_010292 [Solanum stoloniferum]|uniref:Uncharacterized protein n=1 Tax=Solanum stoloniferum TaxID=62892 RepID=A0ABD2U9L6_9SOLN
MAIMMKQGLLLWSPCPHSLSPKIQSFKQPIFQLRNKWRKEGEAMLKNFVIQEKSKKKGNAIDFKEILQFRNSAATIIVANALMMTSPLDALAETCEVDNSPFNMLFNMPILLLVALIGATVGGFYMTGRLRVASLLQRLDDFSGLNTSPDTIRWRHDRDEKISAGRLYRRNLSSQPGSISGPWKQV